MRNSTKILVLSMSFACSGAIAQAPKQNLEEPMPYVTPVKAVEHFSSVTAKNGQEWVEQCEKPALKSNREIRVASCFSFFDGARRLAVAHPDSYCALQLEGPSFVGAYDISLFLGKEKPYMEIGEIMEQTFRFMAPLPCRNRQ